MMPTLGGVIAHIDPRGARYVTAGMVRGWMAVPSDGRESDVLHLVIDGKRVATCVVDYTRQRLHAGNGYVDRHLFTLDLPEKIRQREVRFSVTTDAGLAIGSGEIDLLIDAAGDGALLRLNPYLRAETDRVLDLVRRNRLGLALISMQQSYCAEVFSDHNLLLLAARAAADVYDLKSSGILFDQAVQSLPHTYKMLSLAGKVLLKLGRQTDALTFFDKAIALDPAAFDARNARIKAIIAAEDWQRALLECHRLRKVAEDGSAAYAELSGTIAWLNLNLSQPETALTEASVALAQFPANTRLMQMKADALVRLSRYDEAIAIYRKALAVDTKVPLLRKRVASALMLAGEFAEAADQDQGRMHTPTFVRLNNVPEGVPLWRGELQLGGKLLIWAEVNFGVGQNLLHGSILPDVLTLGLDVVLEVEARLVPVFAAAFPQIQVVEQVAPGEERGDWIDQVVCHMPIGNLVRYFRRSRTDFASSKPFLRNDPARTAALREELDAASGGKLVLVGFSWTSSNPFVGDEKSVPLEQLLAALDLPGVGLVNLQYGDHAAAIARASTATGVQVLEARDIDRTNDLAGMCDLVAAMDVVVCIGHTTAHLAGGLGVPNLVLVPSSPFAHWLGSGETCVWYPQSRILRQTPEQRGDWSGALAKASDYLGGLVLGIGLPAIVGDRLVDAWRSGQVDPVRNFYRNALILVMAEYEYRQIDELIAEIHARYPKDADLLTLVGDCRFRVGNFELALSAYRSAIDAGGDTIELTVRMNQVLLECYELDLAAALMRKMFQENKELAADRPDLVVMEAQILSCLDRTVPVIERLKPLIEADPANEEAAITIANAYSVRGEFDKARRALAQSLQPENKPEVISALGVAIGRSGAKEWGAKAIARAQTRGADPLGTFWLAQFDKNEVKRSARLFNASEVTLPKEAAERVTVFVCMDTSYCLRYLGSLAASIAKNSPETNLHVHIVNPHDEARDCLRTAREILGADRVSHGFETARLVDFDPDQRKTYFASIRFVRLAEVMRDAPGTYFEMDVDNLVRGDVGVARALTRNAHVLIRNRFSVQPHLAVAACGIVLADHDAARDFMNRTAEYILDAFHTGHVAWFLDQIALTFALKGRASDPSLTLKVKQLPTTLLDWDFAAESLVWTGKGKRRLKNQRYRAEYQHYFDVFNQTKFATA